MPSLPADPPLDPSADEGRALLRDELGKVPYGEHRTLLERLRDWIGDQLDTAAASQASFIGQLLLLTAAALIVAAIVYAATRARRGRVARASGVDAEVLEDTGLSAADYRRRAEQAERAGDHVAALLDRFRAIVRSGQERALLEDSPGGTAHELAGRLAAFFPDDRPALAAAADRFDEVRYGGARVDASAAASMRELDALLQRRRPRHDAAHDSSDLVAPGRWAP